MNNIHCVNCRQNISKAALMCPNCGHPNNQSKRPSSRTTLLRLGFAIAALWLFSQMYTGFGELEPQKSIAVSNVELRNVELRRGGLDLVMMLDVTIFNSGKVDVKDVELECLSYSGSGTQIDKNKRTVFEIIPAGRKKNVKEFNMGYVHGQAKRTECTVKDLVLM